MISAVLVFIVLTLTALILFILDRFRTVPNWLGYSLVGIMFVGLVWLWFHSLYLVIIS